MRFTTVVLVSVSVAVFGCSTGEGSLSGEGCDKIGGYRCDGDIVYLCRLSEDKERQSWEAVKDCAKSSTPNCMCTVLQGLGTCTVNAEQSSSAACQGGTP